MHGNLDASKVDVSVKGGEATLSGTVDSRFAKRTTEGVTEAVPGVKDVHNNLTIQQQGQSGQAQSQSANQTRGRTRTAGKAAGEQPSPQ